MTETVAIKVESPLQSEVAALLRQSDIVAARLYPGGYRRPITAESLAKPGTHLLVARIESKPLDSVLFSSAATAKSN